MGDDLWRLSAILNDITDLIFSADKEGHIKSWNLPFQEYFGLTPMDLEGLQEKNLFSETQLQSLQEQKKTLDEGETAFLLDLEFRNSFGQQELFELKGSPIEDSTGAWAGYVAVLRNITEWKKQLDLKESQEDRFRHIFEHVVTGICEVDLKGYFIRANDRLKAILGYSEEELKAKHIQGVMNPEDFQDELDFFAQLSSGEITHYSKETRYISKSGELKWGNKTVKLIRDELGIPLNYLMVIEDITERKKLEQELTHLALKDGLTGLYNRRSFMDLARKEWSRSDRSDNPMIVVMVDLDHFKQVNDTYGHEGGDQVLKAFSRATADQLREVDILGRWGGEEFIYILSGASQAEGVMERVRLAAESLVIPYGDQEIHFTISQGGACRTEDTQDLESLIRQADENLYKAKKSGRNRFFLT